MTEIITTLQTLTPQDWTIIIGLFALVLLGKGLAETIKG